MDRLERREPGRDRLEAVAGRDHAPVHPAEQVVLDGLVARVAGQVTGLARVVDQVEQPLIGARQRLAGLVSVLAESPAGADDQLEPRGADHRLLVFEVLAEDHVMRPGRRACSGSGARGRSPASPAARASRSRCRTVGRMSTISTRSTMRRSLGRSAGPAHDQRDPHGRLVEAMLLEPPVLAEHVAVVADVDDQRLVRELPSRRGPGPAARPGNRRTRATCNTPPGCRGPRRASSAAKTAGCSRRSRSETGGHRELLGTESSLPSVREVERDCAGRRS